MIDAWMARLLEPRFGVVFFTGLASFLMSSHWTPMALPGAIVIVLAIVRPQLVVRPVVWWVMAALWFAAEILVQDRMEDHVYLFAVWLVALAICLHADDDTFIERAAWQARVLIGVTFTVAVAWKLYFNQYVTGMTLWGFIVLDRRFEPLAAAIGVPDTAIEQGRAGLMALLAGSDGTVSVEAPSDVLWRITAVSILTLVMEATIALSHLLPDTSKLAALRLPSILLFGVVTYAVVPVFPFAALLATLAIVVARWRREVMWVFPVMVLTTAIRVAFLQT